MIIVTFTLHMVEKNRTGPERRSLEGARLISSARSGTSGHAVAHAEARERASLALWARPVAVHARSTVESTADDHLTLDGDDNIVVVSADPEHAAGSRMRAADHRIVGRRTQWRSAALMWLPGDGYS